jgi:hypothetical protein
MEGKPSSGSPILRSAPMSTTESTADVAAAGMWGIRDEATCNILTARREPPLLLARSRLDESGRPEVTLPDGTICSGVGPSRALHPGGVWDVRRFRPNLLLDVGASCVGVAASAKGRAVCIP